MRNILDGENEKKMDYPFLGHVNGGACFTDFDYNVEDGKTTIVKMIHSTKK